MSAIKPPVELQLAENKKLRDYMLEYASKPDFEYPPVSFLRETYHVLGVLFVLFEALERRGNPGNVRKVK